MSRRFILPALVILCVCASAAFVTACGEEEGPLFPGVSPELNAQLVELRRALEPFRRIEAAQAAGYDIVVSHPTGGHTCLDHGQLGAMGVHYLDAGLVDGAVSPNAPEVLIYEPQADGSLELVGAEFVIPFAIHGEDQPAPTLFGQQLTHNFTFDLWALHVWVERANPNGVFADYNPAVSCQYASS
jgi:hypothetical protein